MSLDTVHTTMPSGNKKHIVIAIDHFKLWIEVNVFTNITSQSIMNFFYEKNNETQVSKKDTD